MNLVWLIALVFFARNSASQNFSEYYIVNYGNRNTSIDLRTLQVYDRNSIYCRYGVEACNGEHGSQDCRCFEPCKNVICPTGSPCSITFIKGTQYKGVCRSITKPGRCPATSTITNCGLECMADSDCAGDFKCCSNGCGTSCLDPMEAINGSVAQPLSLRNTEQHVAAVSEANVTLDEFHISSEESYNNTMSVSYKEEHVNFTSIDSTCEDNAVFARCDLVVDAGHCRHRYYIKFCCASCTAAGQLPI